MTVLVTGGTSGIGRAIAVHWAGLGHDVIVNYHRDDKAASETRRLIEEQGRKAVAIKADLSDQPGIDRLIAEVRAQAQEIDLYVHCAALAVAGGLEINPDDLRKAVNVNAISVVPIVQGLRSALRKGSNIVYISSIGAQRYVPSYIALGPTKALGEMLIKYIAKELAPDGIRANIVAAGPVDTPAFRKMFGDDYKSRLAAAAEINPSKRNIEFADIVAAVELVTSPAAVMLQGQVVRTDGGLYL